MKTRIVAGLGVTLPKFYPFRNETIAVHAIALDKAIARCVILHPIHIHTRLRFLFVLYLKFFKNSTQVKYS